jgi:hypothetical protein
MTTCSLLARTSRRLPLLTTSSALVVALLLLFSGRHVSADAGIPLASASLTRPSTIDSTVTKVTGTVLDLVGGQIQIDVSGATITNGDDPNAGPLPSTAIPVGARVVAQVTILATLPPISFPPPPLPATSVVVFLPRDGRLAGTIEGVDVADGKFTMFYRAISTNSATTWSGVGPSGPVKGIGDLVAGMYATVAVVASSGGLLAASVDAIGFVTPPHLIAFRGPVQTISPTQWQIAGRVVQVDSDTKIVGDPKVGDIVDVVALVHDPLPGSLAPSYLVAVSITKAPAITPPPGDRATEFDGIVESIPTAPTANGAPLGHWEISSRDVIVNGLTKLDTGIIVGSAVHVKGTFVMASAVVGSLSSTQFVATEITKK